MGSRIRLDPDHIYEVFLELGKPSQPTEAPYVLQKFPETYSDEELLKSVPKFAFPCLSDDYIQEGEHFTFVLTDIESRFKFGFCRISLRTQTCLCLISCLPWHQVFYRALDSISEQLSSSSTASPFLSALHSTKSFRSGENVVVTVPNSNWNFRFICPVPNQLPSLPDSKNLLEFCNCFDVNNMMVIFVSLLCERRILACSQSLGRLTACIAGASLLLHPMNWQHLYIPVLPPHLLDYCSAPMPYLIGLHSSVMKKVHTQELGDTVILNVDENTVKSQYDDLSILPEDVASSLKRHLKQQDKMHGNQSTGDGMARAFLKAMVALIGGYRDALRFRPGEPITFDPDAFIVSRPVNMQPLLRKILQFQTFQQFVSDRLDLLNAGEGFKDEFDIEASLYSDKWGTQSRYKDWVNHMKKQGKKLKRESKDKWLEFTAKVRDRSGKTWKDLASRIDEIKKDEPGSLSASPNAKSLNIYSQPHRPPRPPPPNLSRALGPVPAPRQSTIRRQSLENKVQRYHPILDEAGSTNDASQMKMERLSIDDSDLNLNPLRRINTDLLDDPDIQKAFRKSYSLEDFNPGPVCVDFDDEEPSDTVAAVTWDQLSVPDALDGEKWTPANSDISLDVSLNSKSSGSTTGSDFVPARRAVSARPIPSQRRSTESVNSQFCSQSNQATLVQSSTADKPLITLDTSSSNSFNSLENIEFDPLKQPVIKEQKSLRIDHSEKILAPVPKPRHTKVPRRPGTSPGSSPRPEVGWSASHAVEPSPPPFRSMREARAAFIQEDIVKPVLPLRQESLDQFDPLASGQLVVDMPSDYSSRRSMAEDEDNLLKEWNLDFDRIRPGNDGGLGVPVSALAFSMPNLHPSAFPSSGAGYMGGYPLPRPIHPQISRQVTVGPSFDQRVPGMIGTPPVPSTNLRMSHHPPPNVLRPAPIALRPSTSPAVANNGVSARSATLPINSSLLPGFSRINPGEVTRVPLARDVPSDQSALNLLKGFDPLLPPKHLTLDFGPQNNNNNDQWEKFE